MRENESKREKKRGRERKKERVVPAAASMESYHGLAKKSLDLSLGVLKEKLLQGTEKCPDVSLSERVREEREEEEEGLQWGVRY